MAENLQSGAEPLLVSVPRELEELRPDLQRFFDAMVYKLRRNKNKGRWEDLDLDKTLSLLRGELTELEEAVLERSSMEILMEAADVGNFAMIAANIALERIGV